jgi:membrane protease YdiL (CAAX protease family)
MGWITLIVLPIPAFWALWYFEEWSILEVLSFHELSNPVILIGIELGLIYALFALAVSQHPYFEEMSYKQEQILKSLQLNWVDILFISLCAGIGEEILFRAGIQHWLGPWLTSLLFVALHGYINPLSLKKSLYGILIMPFVIILAFAYEAYGLWFCITAHFSYDLLLFRVYTLQNKK